MEGLDDVISLTEDTPFYPDQFYESRWKRLTARGVALVVLAVAVHLPLLGGKALWADEVGKSQDSAAVSASELAMAWTRPHLWRRPPLARTLAFLENRFGGDTVELQSVSLLLHAANCVLLWLILRRLQLPGAWLAAAVWAVHPAEVQNIAWMAQQERLWGALFGLASLLLVLRAARVPRPIAVEVTLAPGTYIPEEQLNRWSVLRPLIAAGVFFVAALLCEPGLFGLPLIGIALLGWRRGLAKADAKLGIPFLGISLICIALGLAGGHTILKGQAQQTGGAFSQGASAVLTTASDSVRLVAREIWPQPAVGVFASRQLSVLSPWSYWAILVMGVLVVTSAMLRDRVGLPPLLLLACFVSLIPTVWDAREGGQIGWFMPGRDASQYLLGVPIVVGVIALLVTLVSRVRSQAGLAMGRLVLGLAVLGTLGTISWQGSSAYAGTESLWLTAIDGNPSDQNAHAPLALWYLEEGRKADAIHQICSIERLESCDDYQTLIAYGRVVEAGGGAESDAIQAYSQAVQMNESDARAQSYLAGAYARNGQKERAISCLNTALLRFPDDPELRNDLGLMLSQEGRTTPAMDRFREAIQLDPSFTPARLNLATVLFSQGNLAEAAAQLQEVVKIDPRNFEAFHNAGVMLCELGDYVRAQPMLQAAVRLKPDSAEARNDLGVALVATRNFADATVQFNMALGIRPDYEAARQNLSIAQRRQSLGASTRESLNQD